MSRFSRGLVVWVMLLACLMQAPPVLVGAPAKSIVIGVPSIPPTADPHQFTAPIPTIFQHNVFDALLELDPDGNLQPSLAISWKRLNNTAWEYKLRPNVRFHNGQLLSAEDVKFTYTRGADTKNPLTVGVSPRITTLERVEVVDASTVRFHLGSPDAGWERKTAVLKIIPAKHYEALGERQAALRPVGTGAFSVSRFVPGEVVVLEAATSSWRGRPKLQRIELRSIPETTVRASALKAGDVQMAVAISPDEVALLRQAGFIVTTGELARVETVGMNTWTENEEYKPFWDRRVRQALNYAVDKAAITRNIFRGITSPIGQYVTRGVFGYNPEIGAYPYDPQKAKELLSSAGYPNGFRIRMHASQGACLGDRESAEAVAGYLRSVGVQVDLQVLEFAAFQDLFHSLGRRAPLFYECWTAPPQMDAEAVLVNISADHRSKRYMNALFARLLNESRTELNSQRRTQMLHRLGRIAYDDPPAIFLFAEPQTFGHTRALVGFSPRLDGVMWMKDMDLR